MSLGQLGNGPLSPVSGQFWESNNTSVEIKVLLQIAHLKSVQLKFAVRFKTQVGVVKTAPDQGSRRVRSELNLNIQFN